MKFQTARIKDVAQAAGLSASTVSRALRDSHEISQQTKALVLQYAEKLNYAPNPMARGLRNRKSQAIAIVVSDLSNAFFSQVLSGVESAASQEGYKILIVQQRIQDYKSLKELEQLTASVDGILMSVPSENANLDILHSLHQRGLPIVLFDRIIDGMKVHKVVLDNSQAAFIATSHLIKLGYRRIAAIVNATHVYKASDRITGYRNAMVEAGLEYESPWIKKCKSSGPDQKEVDSYVNTLLKKPHSVEAFVVLDDQLTKAVLKAVRAKGLRIPDDVAIVGFSNSDFYELLSPALTIVQQPAHDMGYMAAQLLMKQIKSKRPITDFEHVVMEPQLITRESAGERKR